MKKRASLFKLTCLFFAAALLMLDCAASLYQEGADDEPGMSDAEFVKEIKQQIDYQVRWRHVMNDIESHRGKIVKWSGHIYHIWDDKVQIWGSEVVDQPIKFVESTDDYLLGANLSGIIMGDTSFLLLLDHPLPRESRIGDMIQTVTKKDAVYALGSIVDIEVIVTPNGTNITMPVLKAYAISKANDREFRKPVWVGNK